MIRTSFLAATLVLATAGAVWSADNEASQVSRPKTPDTAAMSSISPKPFRYVPKESDVVTGKEDAPVTLVEYASLSCPHCSRFYATALPALTAKYIDTGKVKLVYRNYPLNDPALKAAELVECADPSNRHAFVKVLFNTQVKWAYDASYRDALGNIAVLGGIGRLKFESCMNDKTIEKNILAIAKEAQDYRVDSTPSFFINETKYKGDHDAVSLGKALDAALASPSKK